MGLAPQTHSYLIYIELFFDQLKYDCYIFRLKDNQRKFNRFERLVKKNLRTALEFRQSTTINILMVETKETPLDLRSFFLLFRFKIRRMPVAEAEPQSWIVLIAWKRQLREEKPSFLFPI